IQHWQMVAEALQSGKVTTKRAFEIVRGKRALSSPAYKTVASLTQRAESLENAVNLTEDVARRAARMVLTTEVQTGQMMEHVPELRMVAEELRTLAERATEAAHQMADAVSDTRLALQDAAAEITVTSQARAEMMESGIGMVNNIDKVLQATESTLAAHAQRLNQVRTVISHAQVAEEISRALQESGMFLHSAGAEAQKIAQAAEQLVQLDQRLLASLAPFKLPEPPGRLPNMSNMMLDERSAVSSAKKPSY
ncbi:MAG TPA: methyl-accepting chemotaxis protein, partial [Ktedonobacteraceae bacterium]